MGTTAGQKPIERFGLSLPETPVRANFWFRIDCQLRYVGLRSLPETVMNEITMALGEIPFLTSREPVRVTHLSMTARLCDAPTDD
jgi:hypothetical protein